MFFSCRIRLRFISLQTVWQIMAVLVSVLNILLSKLEFDRKHKLPVKISQLLDMLQGDTSNPPEIVPQLPIDSEHKVKWYDYKVCTHQTRLSKGSCSLVHTQVVYSYLLDETLIDCSGADLEFTDWECKLCNNSSYNQLHYSVGVPFQVWKMSHTHVAHVSYNYQSCMAATN